MIYQTKRKVSLLVILLLKRPERKGHEFTVIKKGLLLLPKVLSECSPAMWGQAPEECLRIHQRRGIALRGVARRPLPPGSERTGGAVLETLNFPTAADKRHPRPEVTTSRSAARMKWRPGHLPLGNW